MIRLSPHPLPASERSAFNKIRALQYPSGRALSFPDQPFKPFAFLAAQPHGSQQRLWVSDDLCCHNILLYRNLLRSHDYPLRQSLATKAND